MGIISAIGNTVAENHTALLANKSGITSEGEAFTRYSGTLPFGVVPVTTPQLKSKLKAHEPGVTRTSLLALHALKEAIADAGLGDEEVQASNTALISGTTVGGMCLTDELYHDAHSTTSRSEYLSSYDFASVSLFLQEHLQMTGLMNTINTACSSSANAIMYGARLLKHGLAKRAIVGGSDSLSKFTVNGFNALRILSPDFCRPFDQHRQGLNLGEGAAYLVLEKEEDAKGKKIYAELSGYFNTNDAFHPSSLSEQGDGPYLAMKGALDMAGLQPEQIDHINAHGTGTENNDEAESRAMINLYSFPPPFMSTKGYTGHILGAASSVEAVYSLLNITNQEVYASLNFENAIPATRLNPITHNNKAYIYHVMSNSFGFGGNCTSLIFSKV
jgi:3-oxoacyl-(acyl-carrier-protein) synthase